MVYMETIGLLVAVALLVYYLVTKNNNHWEKKGIAFEKPLPIFGNLLDNMLGRQAIGQIMTNIYKKFPNEKVVGTYQFNSPALMVRDPEMVHSIFTTDYSNFAKNNFPIDENQDPVLGKNMFCQTGESWKRTRQALSPAFTINKIRANYDKFVAQADKLVDYLKKNPEIEMKGAYSLYTSEVVADTGLGIDGHSFDDKDAPLPKLGKMMFNSTFIQAMKFVVLIFLPSIAKLFKMRFAPSFVYDYFDFMVRGLIRTRESDNAKRTDLLQYYVDLRKKRLLQKNDDQSLIHEDDIIAGLVSFFMEGFETSSVVGSLLLMHLVQDQPLQKRLQKEIDELFEKTDGKPSLEEMSNLPLLQRIFEETLRFYPIDTLNKICTKTCELDIGNGRKLIVEEGTSIVIPLRGIHTDPKYWSNPDKFDPDRFLEGAKETLPKGAYMPFGEGPRICIGQRQATAAIKVATVKILRHFTAVRSAKTANKFIQDPNHFLVTQKDGIHMKFVQRSV